MNARLAGGSRNFLLTNWTTVRGSTMTSVIQDPEEWLDVAGFADMTFYIDVSEVTTPVGGLLLLYLESSPTADESDFSTQPLVGPIPLTLTGTSPLIAKTASAGATPLSRFVRWRLASTAAAAWDVTMRIRAVANRTLFFAPTTLGNCVFWVRADRGLTFGTTAISGWADQSGLNDPGRRLTPGTSPPTLNTVDSTYANQMTVAFSGNANCYFVNAATWSPVVAQPQTWVVVGHRTSVAGANTIFDGNSAGFGAVISVSNAGVISASSGAGPINSAAGNFWGGASAFMYESVNPNSTAYLNSFSTVLMTGAAGADSINSITVGAHSIFFGGGGNWVGPIAELMLFTGTLSATKKALLRTYLNNRYALSIT